MMLVGCLYRRAEELVVEKRSASADRVPGSERRKIAVTNDDGKVGCDNKEAK